MKRTLLLIASILQLTVGLLAVCAFVFLTVNGQVTPKWIVTLILALAFTVLGTVGILDHHHSKH